MHKGRNKVSLGRARYAAVVAAVAATLATACATASAQAPPEFFGVVPQNKLDPASFERMAGAGVGVARLRIDWATIDSSEAPDDFYWPIFDPLVLDAARNGIRILPFLYGTPPWVARGLDGRQCSGTQCAPYAPRSKAALEAWARFVRGAVARYGPHGSLWEQNPNVPRMPIDVWQVWNEQNSEVFFAPKPKPKRYKRLLARASRAIREADPSARVLLGGMAELAGSERAVPASGFLADLYRLNEVRKLFDAIAPHPYGTTIGKVRSQVKMYRRATRKGGDRGIPMYVTEIGAGSADGGHNFNLGAEGQASLLQEIYAYFESKRVPYNIETVDWFSWQDTSDSFCLWCSTSGLLAQDGSAKPSLGAFTSFTGGS